MKMKRFGFLVVALLLAVASASAMRPEPREKTPPPNIILVTADDMGLQLNSYGDDTVPTPHLNRLAAEGLQCGNGYVTQASCSPSRSSMLTGLYPHENGQLGLSHRGYAMHQGIPNLPGLLKGAGYYTGKIGKVHVDPIEELSFDFYDKTTVPRNVKAMAEATEEIVREAGDRPFFINYSLIDPHHPFFERFAGLPETPIQSSEVSIFPEYGEIDTPELREEIAGYYNGIQRVDAGIGFLREMLERRGKAENTLIVFLGDHGPPFYLGKLSCYEFGIKVPFILHWPDGIEGGRDTDAFISAIDIMPTALELAGVSAPEYLPGVSLVPFFRGEPTEWRQTVFAEFNSHGPFEPGLNPQRCIRKSRYKLIHNLRPGVPKRVTALMDDILQDPKWANTPTRLKWEMLQSPPEFELYDLASDPHELRNLSGNSEYAEVEKSLATELLAWRRETGDPFLDREVLAAYVEAHERFFAERERIERVAAEKGEKAPFARIDWSPFQQDWQMKP